MSTSELTPSEAEGPTISQPPSFTLCDLMIPEDSLKDIRRAMYHSKGDGYYVFRRFLDWTSVHHIRKIWSTVDPQVSHELFPGKQFIHAGCPNYYVLDQAGNRTFHNFLWNPPLDELTYIITWYVQMLRNRISGRAPLFEVFPFGNKSVGYRVIMSHNAQTWNAPHRDYMDFARRFEKNRYDLSRLQATLFLSEKGTDYHGKGFTFERNDGRIVVFGSDVSVRAGDLVIWRYNNLHSVEEVWSADDQLGFMRIVYPPEDLHAAQPVQPTNPPARGLPRRLRAMIRKFLVG